MATRLPPRLKDALSFRWFIFIPPLLTNDYDDDLRKSGASNAQGGLVAGLKDKRPGADKPAEKPSKTVNAKELNIRSGRIAKYLDEKTTNGKSPPKHLTGSKKTPVNQVAAVSPRPQPTGAIQLAD